MNRSWSLEEQGITGNRSFAALKSIRNRVSIERDSVLRVILLNGFPQGMASQVSDDHQKLMEIFNLTPTTLEMETQRRLLEGS